MFEKWFNKTPKVVEQAKAVTYSIPGTIVPSVVVMKPKKWITFHGRVGIITGVKTDGDIRVDFVNDKGETVATDVISPLDVKLARYLEIPAGRRPDSAFAATLGYV